MGQRPKTAFSEYGHFAYQIKGNDTYSNMLVNILPVDPHDPRGGGGGGRCQKVKLQLFQNMVMLHIKLKGITNAARCKHIFCPYTHPRPLGRGQRSKHFFSESSHATYQIIGNGA